MSRGKMIWFNDAKGHGFIASDAGDRVYVARSGFSAATDTSCLSGAVGGLDVTFDVVRGGDRLEAVDVAFAAPADQRRARRRHSR